MVEEQTASEEPEYISPFKKPVFALKHLAGEKPKQDILSIRLSDVERQELMFFKKMLSLDSDGFAYKLALTIAKNVLLGTFGQANVEYLCRQSRVRPKSDVLSQNAKM